MLADGLGIGRVDHIVDGIVIKDPFAVIALDYTDRSFTFTKSRNGKTLRVFLNEAIQSSVEIFRRDVDGQLDYIVFFSFNL